MSRKKQQGTGSKIFSYVMLIPAFFSLIANLCAMMHEELALMRKRILLITFLILFLFVLMMSSWICINALLFNYLTALAVSTTTAIMLILSLNLLLFVITCLVIALLKIDPTFPETRKAINDIITH